MKKFICGVVGNPIAHSLSPRLHYGFAKEYNINLEYQKILAQPDNFSSIVKSFFENRGTGLNITAPFKHAAFKIADKTTERCHIAQSANTLWLENGILMADSTDGEGFLKHLQTFNQDIKNILILGAGGAVRSICYELGRFKYNIYIKNRTIENIAVLKKIFSNLKTFSNNNLCYDLIIQATSNREYSDSWNNLLKNSHPGTIFYDLNYYHDNNNPWITWADKQKLCAIDGYQMLYQQAKASFLIWFGNLIT